MHKTLQRQILKFLGSEDRIPKDKSWQDFFQAINDTYIHFDQDRNLLERSLELSSKELGDKNKQLQEKMENIQKNATPLKVS